MQVQKLLGLLHDCCQCQIMEKCFKYIKFEFHHQLNSGLMQVIRGDEFWQQIALEGVACALLLGATLLKTPERGHHYRGTLQPVGILKSLQ